MFETIGDLGNGFLAGFDSGVLLAFLLSRATHCRHRFLMEEKLKELEARIEKIEADQTSKTKARVLLIQKAIQILVNHTQLHAKDRRELDHILAELG